MPRRGVARVRHVLASPTLHQRQAKLRLAGVGVLQRRAAGNAAGSCTPPTPLTQTRSGTERNRPAHLLQGDRSLGSHPLIPHGNTPDCKRVRRTILPFARRHSQRRRDAGRLSTAVHGRSCRMRIRSINAPRLRPHDCRTSMDPSLTASLPPPTSVLTSTRGRSLGDALALSFATEARVFGNKSYGASCRSGRAPEGTEAAVESLEQPSGLTRRAEDMVALKRFVYGV